MSEFIWYILFGLIIFTIGAYIWTWFNSPGNKNKKSKKNETNSDEEWRNDPRFK